MADRRTARHTCSPHVSPGSGSGYNRQVIRGYYLAALLFVAGCSTRPTPTPQAADLPAIPKLQMTAYRVQIRERLENAWHAVQARPLDAESNGNLGMLLHAFDQTEAAEVCYRRAHHLDPKRFQWAYYLGLVQALQGRNAEAAASLRAAMRIGPGYVPARIKLAEVLLGLGGLDEGRRVCESLLKDNPQIAPAWYWLGRIASATGQFTEAEEHYRKACQLWPTYATAHYALALSRQKSGHTAEARIHLAAWQKYKAGGDPEPEDPVLESVRALDNSALAHLTKGVDLENAGLIEQAIVEHEEALRQDPKLSQAYANLISLYARAGQPDKAEEAYRNLTAINPNLPQSHYDYGVFMVSRGNFTEAESAFRKALASSPNYAEAHSNLGAMLERRGKFEEAAREYKDAIADKPNFREAHYQLGHLLLMQKKTPEAIAQLSQTVTPEDGETPRFMYALGIAYAEAGDFSSAQGYLRQAGQRAASLNQAQLMAQIQTTLARVEQRLSR